MNYFLPILSTILLMSACTSPAKKCSKITQGTEEQASEFQIGDHDDQATINMKSYDETQYWKGKMKMRLANIRSIYEKADWYEPKHKVLFFKNLDASQIAFETYVKAQVELEYPEDEWTGSGIPMCINSSYTKYYKQRYFDLEVWEKGTAKGQMCGGTALTQYELEEMKKNQQ